MQNETNNPLERKSNCILAQILAANAPISRNVDVFGSSSPFRGCSHQEHSSPALDGLCSQAVWGLTHADEMNAWPVWPRWRSLRGIEPHRERPDLCPSPQPRGSYSGGVEGAQECPSGALRLCQAWDVISFFHSLNCWSTEISRNVSVFLHSPLFFTEGCFFISDFSSRKRHKAEA